MKTETDKRFYQPARAETLTTIIIQNMWAVVWTCRQLETGHKAKAKSTADTDTNCI